MEIRGVKYKDIAFWTIKGTGNENGALLFLNSNWEVLLEIKPPFCRGNFVEDIKTFSENIGEEKFNKEMLFGDEKQARKSFEVKMELRKVIKELEEKRKAKKKQYNKTYRDKQANI